MSGYFSHCAKCNTVWVSERPVICPGCGKRFALKKDMEKDYDLFWRRQAFNSNFRQDLKYLAYLCTDYMGDTCAFSIHKTVKAAEKRYGDVSRHYRGSSQSDYEVIILEMDEVFSMLEKGEIQSIDWKTKTIHWGN